MQKPHYIPLSGLIDDLKHFDFSVSIETYLSLNRLLAKLGEGNPLADVDHFKTQLCPIFAKTPRQQEIFYRLFEKHFSAFRQVPQTSDSPPAAAQQAVHPLQQESAHVRPSSKPRPLHYGFIALGIVAIALKLVQLYFKMNPLRENIEYTTVRPMPVYRDTATYREAEPEVIQPTPPEKKDIEQVRFSPMMVPDVEHFEVKNIFLFRFSQYGTQVLLGVVVVLAIFYLMYELFLYRNRKFILEKRKGRKPDYSWKIDLGDLPGIGLPREFFQMASLMRKRVVVHSEKPDMQKTVLATAKNGGMLELVMTVQSRPAEYLVLIDQHHHNDLQVFYCDLLLDTLGANGVHITRYYYSRDIRKCYDPLFKKPVNLSTLAYHYGEHRLLIMGHAESLYNQEEKRLFVFTDLFRNWESKALLTYTDGTNWSEPEFAVAEQFVISPFSLPGFTGALEAFEHKRLPGSSQMQEDTAGRPSEAPSSPLYYTDIIKARLLHCEGGSHALLHWFGACCIYPELNADLVMFIGYTLSLHGDDVFTLENLEKICALSVFRQGKIPWELREAVLHDEEFLPQGKKVIVAGAIRDLLEKNAPADKSTAAYDRWRMNVVLMETLLDQKEKQKRKLLEELKDLQQVHESKEQMVIDTLNRNSAMGKFAVPEALKKFFFKGGQPYQGAHPYMRAFVFLLVAGILVSMLNFDVKQATVEHYNSKTYYIDNRQKLSSWNTYKAAFFYNPDHPGEQPYVYEDTKGFQTAQEFMNKAYGADSTFIGFRLNRMVMEFNRGVMEYKKNEFRKAGSLIRHSLDMLKAAEKEGTSATQQSFIASLKNDMNYTLGLCWYHLGNMAKAKQFHSEIDYANFDRSGLKELLEMK